MATVSLKGDPFNTNGELPTVGSVAPECSLVNGQLADVGLDAFRGRR